MSKRAIALILELCIEQGPGMVADGAHPRDPGPLRGVEQIMDIDLFAAFDPMHPPLI